MARPKVPAWAHPLHLRSSKLRRKDAGTLNSKYLKEFDSTEKRAFSKRLPIKKFKYSLGENVFERCLPIPGFVIEVYHTQNLWIAVMLLAFTNCVTLGQTTQINFHIDFIGLAKLEWDEVCENTLKTWAAILEYTAWLILLYLLVQA